MDEVQDERLRIIRALQSSGVHAGLAYGVIVAQVIVELRKARGLSQEQLAQLTGLTQSSLSRIEQGETLFNADHAIMISAALEIKPHKIFALADLAVDWLRRQDLNVADNRAMARNSILGVGAAALLVGPTVLSAVNRLVDPSSDKRRKQSSQTGR